MWSGSQVIDLGKLQEEIHDWQIHNFPDSGANEQLIGIVEELGELAHARLKARQQIRAIDMYAEQDAIGDMLIYLFNYCSEMGYSVEHIINETWKTVSLRDWLKYPKDGMSE